MPHKLGHVKVGVFFNFVTGIVFSIASLIVVLLVNANMRQQALMEAEAKARMLLDRNLATHTYFSHDLKPNLFEWSDPLRADDYFDPTWMSSTYAVREMIKYFGDLSAVDYYYKEAAIDARSPENEADEYERAFIEQLNADPGLTDRSLIRILDGQPYFVTLRRGEVMEESCLRCHSTSDQAPAGLVDEYGPDRSFEREVDEVVSAISIRTPLSVAYTEANRFSLRLSGMLLALLAILFGIQYLLNRRLLLAPVINIRSKAIQISTSDEHLGDQIPLPPGRELRELTTAFNIMSSSLRHSRDLLERRVEARTADLAATVRQLEHQISQREQAEKSLRKSNRRLEETLTQLRNTQDQLMKQERLAAVGQLAAGIAHDFNNLLTSISLYTQMSLHADELSPQLRARLEVIGNQTDQAAHLVQQVLDFGRRSVLERQALALAPFLDEIGDLLKRTLPENIHVTLACEPDVHTIDADSGRVRQALVNLALNARDAMPQGGELHIRVSRPTTTDEIKCATCGQTVAGSEWVKLTVTDTGTGIPSNVLPYIFEPFFTTRAPLGHGLGLAQVYGIVKQHRGHIDVQTEVGQGTTVALYWPLSSAPQPEEGELQ
jgi:hypothetical protein